MTKSIAKLSAACFIIVVLALAANFPAGAGVASNPAAVSLAPTPPMGWNSWDSYGPTVREDEVKANADYMAAHLAKFGWQYIIVDIEWYQPNSKAHGYIPGGAVTVDEFGRFVPAVNRFPSAAAGQGFARLAAYVHSKGLKFGFHIMRGIPREAVEKNLPIKGTPYHAADIADKINVCKWQGMEDTYGVDMSKPGAQAYYDSLAELYASWGADYIKADDMDTPARASEILALHEALKKTGRPIVLSLSPGPSLPEYGDFLAATSQLWRISNDFWDNWPSLKRQFEIAHSWESYSHPGSWPDADMLPLGRIGIRAERGDDRSSLFTHDEQQTVMTLWSIFRSPLMFGGDLPSNDAFTLALITNPEVLAVNQNSAGGHQSYHQGDTIAWTAGEPGSSARYVAVFNVGDSVESTDLAWSDVGIAAKRPNVRDLWAHKDLGPQDRIRVSLAPHASVLYKIGPK
ncbi:MAG: glycoside hydrolase family 27 protein [Candidatus Acidiferrales bacterium]